MMFVRFVRASSVSAVIAIVAGVLALAGIGAGTAAAAPGTDTRIEFAPGESGSSFYGSVPRGGYDRFYLEASAGQTMNVGLVAAEWNAAFDIYSPSGALLVSEQQETSIVLPESGDYIILVAPTRGSASYDGYVWIGW